MPSSLHIFAARFFCSLSSFVRSAHFRLHYAWEVATNNSYGGNDGIPSTATNDYDVYGNKTFVLFNVFIWCFHSFSLGALVAFGDTLPTFTSLLSPCLFAYYFLKKKKAFILRLYYNFAFDLVKCTLATTAIVVHFWCIFYAIRSMQCVFAFLFNDDAVMVIVMQWHFHHHSPSDMHLSSSSLLSSGWKLTINPIENLYEMDFQFKCSWKWIFLRRVFVWLPSLKKSSGSLERVLNKSRTSAICALG